jgi:hypothetical protein
MGTRREDFAGQSEERLLHDTAGLGGQLPAEHAQIPDTALAGHLVANGDAPATGAPAGAERLAHPADASQESAGARCAAPAFRGAPVTLLGGGLAGDAGFRDLSACATVAVPDIAYSARLLCVAPAPGTSCYEVELLAASVGHGRFNGIDQGFRAVMDGANAHALRLRVTQPRSRGMQGHERADGPACQKARPWANAADHCATIGLNHSLRGKLW